MLQGLQEIKFNPVFEFFEKGKLSKDSKNQLLTIFRRNYTNFDQIWSGEVIVNFLDIPKPLIKSGT